jgi:hypothetical protein
MSHPALKSVSHGFSDMGMAVVKAIEQMIIKIAIVTPLMQALQSAAGGLGLTGLGGAGGTASTIGGRQSKFSGVHRQRERQCIRRRQRHSVCARRHHRSSVDGADGADGRALVPRRSCRCAAVPTVTSALPRARARCRRSPST